jgi:hypothetical protein
LGTWQLPKFRRSALIGWAKPNAAGILQLFVVLSHDVVSSFSADNIVSVSQCS